MASKREDAGEGGTHPALIAAWGTLGVSFVVAGCKYAAYLETGSIALYSDALDCLVHVAAALTALAALRISNRPPDACYPYGYRKIENVSAIVEAMMIIAAALAILYAAIASWTEPGPVVAPWQGLALNGLGTALNAAWGVWLIAVASRWKSAAVKASGQHLLADVWTSGGVLAGFALAAVTGWDALDHVVAVAVALHIGWMGAGMIADAFATLMDRTDPAIAEKIGVLVSAQKGGAFEARAIRARQCGPVTFAEFEIATPGGMAVSEAHAICDALEDAIKAEFGEAVISIHVAPRESDAAALLLPQTVARSIPVAEAGRETVIARIREGARALSEKASESLNSAARTIRDHWRDDRRKGDRFGWRNEYGSAFHAAWMPGGTGQAPFLAHGHRPHFGRGFSRRPERSKRQRLVALGETPSAFVR